MQKKILEPYVNRYRSIIEEGNPEEAYKWDALRNFQNTWDIDAPDFKNMFDQSLQAESENLWASNQYYPKRMMLEFADLDLENAREMFKVLYDEEGDLSLEERINFFLEKCDDFLQLLNDERKPEDKKAKQHYHRDMRAISFYLTFRYPKKYFTYKYSQVKDFLDMTGADTISMRWEPAEKYTFYLRIAKEVRAILQQDEKLITSYKNWLKTNDYNDPENTLMTSDFIFQVAQRLTEKDEVRESAISPMDRLETRKRVTEIPKNVIYYGPPGTGKTYYLRNNLFERFTEKKEVKTESDVLEKIALNYSWWQIIGAALLELAEASVTEILNHRLVKAKDAVSNQKNARAMLWSMLQLHTVLECPNVHYAKRIEPLFFSKNEESRWSVKEEVVNSDVPELYEIIDEMKSTNKKPITTKRYEFITFHQSYSYEEFIEGLRPVVSEEGAEATGEIAYVIKPGILKQIAERAKNDPDHDYALFIDEINRANVSEVFGELITIIEDDKRLGNANAIEVKLPYSGDIFGIPNNVLIIGTMNTADRSVEALDTALRRRFSFIEMQPDPTLLSGPSFAVESIDLERLLRVINSRIARLLTKDHLIGHGFFAYLSDEDIEEKLRSIFINKIIPLLQEYFYDDWSKIGLVLGKNFIERYDDDIAFARFDDAAFDAFEDRPLFRITDPKKWDIDTFKSIYETE